MALAAASVLFTVAFSEIALRLFRPQPLLHDPDAFDSDPVLGGRLKPEFAGTFSSTEYSTRWAINAARYRGAEAGRKREGVMRIAAAGDSFTFGYGVEEEEAWPHALGARLDAAFPGRFEVVNLGVGGYGTAQEVVWLAENLDRGLSPDLVVIGFYFGNDLSDSVRGLSAIAAAAAGKGGVGVAAPAPASRMERLKRYLGSRSHFYALVSERADGLLIRAGLRNVVYPEEVDVLRLSEPDPVRRGWEAVGTALREFASLSRARGFRPLVMAVPMRHMVAPASWERVRGFYERLTGAPLTGVALDHPRERLREIGATEAIDLLDLTGSFRSAEDPARLYFARDQHWTRDGHALAGETLRAWVEVNLIPRSAGGTIPAPARGNLTGSGS